MNQYIQLSDSYQDLMGFKYWMRKHYLIIYFLKNTNLQYWKKKKTNDIHIPEWKAISKMGYKARKPIPSSLVGSKRGNPHVFEYAKFSRPCLRIWDNDGQQPFFFRIFLICFFLCNLHFFFITCFNYIFNFFTSFL
jgi:hypothetical protein